MSDHEGDDDQRRDALLRRLLKNPSPSGSAAKASLREFA
jgi:hypothetical protein